MVSCLLLLQTLHDTPLGVGTGIRSVTYRDVAMVVPLVFQLRSTTIVAFLSDGGEDSARVLEDELVERVCDHSRKNVGQRRERGVLTPTGSCPPDCNCGQTPAYIASGVRGQAIACKPPNRGAICQADYPRCGGRGGEEVRWIKARRNNYSDKEVRYEFV